MKITCPVAQVTFSYTPTLWEDCLATNYADRQIKKSKDLYLRRGAPNSHKIWWDIYYGKLAEIAAYHYMNLECPTSEPDLEIYHNAAKRFEPDLNCPNHNLHIHVKSTTQVNPLSWMFAITDPATQQNLTTNKGEARNEALLFLVKPKKNNRPLTLELKYRLRLNEYNQLLKDNNLEWKKPYSPYQCKSRRALYSEDLNDMLMGKLPT